MLNCVYDLAVSPPTFDFISFLVACEQYRIERKEESIRILVVRGPKNGFRDDDLPPFDTASRQRMLDNIVFPACKLLPSCVSCELWDAEFVDNVDFPIGWTKDNRKRYYGTAVMVHSARNDVFPLTAGNVEKDDRLVTISLRQSSYWPTRNSNVQAWEFLHKVLEHEGYKVRVIQDDELPNAFERAQVYASARLNLFVNNGPAWMAMFMRDVSCVVFKMCSPDAPVVSEEFFTKCGLLPSGQYGRKNHRIVWADDTEKTLVDETFAELEGKIDYDKLPKIDPKTGLYFARFDQTLNNEKEVMLSQARENITRSLPWFVGGPTNTTQALIVGGGPSLFETLPNLRLRQARGGVIYALNGVHDYLIERGVIPDYHVLLDSRAENVCFVQKPDKRVKYLVSAYCHQSVFDALKDYNVTLWISDMEGAELLVRGVNDKPVCLVGGGATVGLKTMFIAYLKGHRNLHFFGFDSCYRDEKNHAYAQPMNDKEKRVEIVANGRKFICAPWMAQQAQTWQQQMHKLLALDCKIATHGDGLIPWIAQYHSSHQQAA